MAAGASECGAGSRGRAQPASPGSNQAVSVRAARAGGRAGGLAGGESEGASEPGEQPLTRVHTARTHTWETRRVTRSLPSLTLAGRDPRVIHSPVSQPMREGLHSPVGHAQVCGALQTHTNVCKDTQVKPITHSRLQAADSCSGGRCYGMVYLPSMHIHVRNTCSQAVLTVLNRTHSYRSHLGSWI